MSRDKVDYGMCVSCSACSIVSAASLNHRLTATSKLVCFSCANLDMAMKAPVYHVSDMNTMMQTVNW